MSRLCVPRFAALVFCVSTLTPVIAASEERAPTLTVEQVRQIVKDELKAREQELQMREVAVIKKEQELNIKESLIKAQESSATPGKSVSADLLRSSSDQKAVRAPGPLALEISGYGDIQADRHTREENADQPEGARGQSKTTFDTERFVLEIEGKHEPTDLELEAEIEFEHGGTGTAQELEFDEFGEFESEVEKGGEVQIEELYLEKQLGNGFSGKVGRFYVALGTLSYFYKPTEYLAVRRPETEEQMLPGQWDEIGVSVEKEFDFGSVTAQVVNGLDSTGFGAENWVSSGHQSRFEGVRAQDLAFVGRVDVDSITPGLLLGASVYVGNSSENRPKDDLDVDGTVTIGSLNYRYWDRSLKTQGAVYLGHLSNAEEISDRNARLSNSLGVDRTPVAEEALGVWSEVGYDLAPWIGMEGRQELSPFFRFDYYDTYYGTQSSLADNGRYERFVYTAGLSYLFDDFLTLKLNWSRRDFGASNIAEQDLFGLGVGFVY